MKSLALNNMADNLAVCSRMARADIKDSLEDSRKYYELILIPKDKRVKVIGQKYGYSDAQVERFLKRLESARQRASNLHRERTHLIRKESRCVHLARMFIKGTPYRMVEETRYSDPNWARVTTLVEGAAPDMLEGLDRWKMGN